MLAAFTARPIIELKSRDKSKIEAVLAYGDRLFVGLNTGSLRIYRTNESVDQDGRQLTPTPVELLREQEKFSKYKVEQLAIIKEANILVSLSNSQVSIYDLQTYELQETLIKTKGASAFAVTSNIVKDASSGIPSIVSRLAVAVKRRLLMWSWHDSELSAQTSELTLVTGIKTLTWATGTRLIAGLSSSYVLIEVETSTVTDIVGPGSIGGAPGQDGGRFGGVGVASIGYMGIGGTAPKPLATRLSEGELLLAKDINTLFIDTEGNSLGRRQIPWSVAPEAIGYSYPFLLALQATRGTLEVRNPETLSNLQSISLPNANQMHVAQPNVSLAHAGKGFLISSERCIWRMDALGYDDQIDALVDRNRLDESISLMGMLEDALLQDKEGRLREVKMLKAEILFGQRRYRESLDLFNDANVAAPPERVIRLYPEIITGDLSTFDTVQQALDDAGTDDSQRQNIEGTNTVGSKTNKEDNDPSPNGLDHKSSLNDLAPSQKRNTLVGVDSSDTSSLHKKHPQSTAEAQVLEGKDLETATSELAGFLVGARTRLQRYLNPDGSMKEATVLTPTSNHIHDGNIKNSLENLLVSPRSNQRQTHQQLIETARLVDTTLFRAYMYVRPSMAGPLFRLPNFCDAKVVNEKLLETGRYNDLIDFFFGKGLHREALDLLKNFGQKDDENESGSQLRGPQRTVGYLQNLPPEMIELILQYAEWPLRADPDLGMEVFLADTENAETLPRAKVLDFLQNIDEKLAIKYLQHIIHELNDTTTAFHQRLIDVYLNGLRSRKFANDGEKATWKDDFLEFLRTSKHYESWKAVTQFDKDDPDLYEARAIVLGNIGEHRQALNIYVFKLKDPEKAEDYCNQIYLTESSSSSPTARSRRASSIGAEDGPPSIYQILLALYLSPPSPHQPQWEPALNILAKHGSRLPASSTMDLIPEILPIKDLESYFRGRIRSANTSVSESRVIAGLRKSIDISEEVKLRLGDGLPGVQGGRNRRVVITEERVCGVCHKRFGGSVIKVLPNNAVVHYGCSVR